MMPPVFCGQVDFGLCSPLSGLTEGVCQENGICEPQVRILGKVEGKVTHHEARETMSRWVWPMVRGTSGKPTPG